MRNVLFSLLICLAGQVTSAVAEPAAGAGEGTYADHRNYFGSGLRYGFGLGPTLTYSRRLNGQWLVGTSVSHDWHSESSEGGSLDNAQYYRDHFDAQSTTIDLTATYYFREEGYARWGFLLRGALGYSHTEGKAGWQRYDRNPAFIIIGDDKRELDSGEDSRKWDSAVARLGGYYQFAFSFQPGARVGHILEFGAGASVFSTPRALAYNRPDGNHYDKNIPGVLPMVEFNYIVAF